MNDELIDLLTHRTRVYDLGRPLVNGIPQSPDHPQFRMSISRRHGDLMRDDGSTGSNEILFTGGHVGTHIDALSHISVDGMLHGGVPISEAMQGGRYVRYGAEEIAPWLCRGVLLDVPAALGRERFDGGEEITVEQLERTLETAGTDLREGDVVLIRTGWGTLFGDRTAFEAVETGMPGIGPDGARWLAAHHPRALGGDTIAFERLGIRGQGGLPAHKILIVDEGIHLIETMNLEELARDRVHEFAFVLSSLPLVGATGAPVRPLALVETTG